MVSVIAVLLLAGLVAAIVVGGSALVSTSSGQTATGTPSQTTDNVEEELPAIDSYIPEEQNVEIATASTDADRDGLDARAEAKMRTDPANPNTDGDRYRDNEDPRPLLTNSADVKIIISDLESQENYDAIDSGMLNQEALATVIVDMIIKNDGNDYASFVKFDGVFLMDGIELKRITKDVGRIDAGESLDMRITYTLRMLDLQQDALSEIKNRINDNVPPVISFEISNLAYEEF